MTPVMQTPLWPETLKSTGQRHETAGTLPKIQAPPYSQYPVLWFEHRGIEEEISNSELFKFMDNDIIGKTPRQKESQDWEKPF
jgi:hypothetical protein